MKQAISPLFQVGICAVGYISATSITTLAQVTSDGTVNTQVNQNGNVAEITGGEIRGSNLFHSFQDFSVQTGNEAFFDNANNISNIFSRVTGGNISSIDGLIRANGSASLFLINPAGIIFGEGARLDIGGSFYGSSASSILFEDGEFSAADLDNPPLLTVNAPIGLGFRDNPGEIVLRSNLEEIGTIESTIFSTETLKSGVEERLLAENLPVEARAWLANGGDLIFTLNQFELFDLYSDADFETSTQSIFSSGSLEINPGQDFALIGGNISIENFNIIAPGGRITLGGLSQTGEVTLNTNDNFLFPENIEKANVSLIGIDDFNDTVISVLSNTGGFVDINAQNLLLENASINLGVVEGISGALSGGDFNADSITLESSSIIADFVGGAGEIEDINLNADSISLSNFSGIVFAMSSGEGIIGDINLNADSISLSNFSSIRSFIEGISFDGMTLQDTNLIAGNINLDANFITLDNSLIDSFIAFSSIEASDNFIAGEGIIGDINLNSDSVSLNFSSIRSFTQGEGIIGDINFNSDSVSLNFSSLNFIVRGKSDLFFSEGEGIIGDINLNSGSVFLNNFSSIYSIIEGEGIIGDINIGSSFITINSQSDIQTQTDIQTDASNIYIDATQSIEISGLDTTISSQTSNSGNAGDISIDTPELKVLDGAQISADNFIVETFEVSRSGLLIRNILEQPVEGSGDAGIIDITANNIMLSDRGGITALSSAGEGGNINLQVDDILSLRGNSEISTTAGELGTPGNGGNINIDSQFIIAFPQGNNDITANAFEGAGGNITIATEGIFGIQERLENPLTNDITASSDTGISGNITINTPDVNPVQGATELSTNVIVPEETSQQACEANRESAAQNGLNIIGKGGIVPEPGLPLNSLNVTVNGESTFAQAIPAPIETAQGKIQPARGVEITKSGEVILTAYRTDNVGERIPDGSANCGQV